MGERGVSKRGADRVSRQDMNGLDVGWKVMHRASTGHCWTVKEVRGCVAVLTRVTLDGRTVVKEAHRMTLKQWGARVAESKRPALDIEEPLRAMALPRSVYLYRVDNVAEIELEVSHRCSW